jgi:branched-chain amino acid transport system substrate-binding protein
VVLTDEGSAAGTALASSFVSAWPAGRAVEWPSGRPEDRAGLAKRVLGRKPDVVLLAAGASTFSGLRERLREAGLRAPILYGGPDIGADELRRLAPGEGKLYLATAFTADGLTEEGKAFARRYRERFKEPPGLPAVEAYDAARLLFRALSAGGPTKGRDELLKVSEFDTLTGPLTWHNGAPVRRLFVVRLGPKGPKLLQTVTP